MAKQRRASLADQLRSAITAAGSRKTDPLSEYEIARQAGIDQGGVTRFMRGERDWTLGTTDLVAEVLGLELVASRAVRPARPEPARPRREPRPRATTAAAIAGSAEPPAGDELPPAA